MLLGEMLLSGNPTIMQILAYSAIGFCLVMFVLAIQTILTALLGKLFKIFESHAKPKAQ